jgi:hypothetical protein
MLAPLGPTRFSTALRTTIIGFAASAVLPARAGEVLRPYLLARREHLNATAAFATIIIERLITGNRPRPVRRVRVPVPAEPSPAIRTRCACEVSLAAAGALVGMIAVRAGGHPERLGRVLRVERVHPRAATVMARFVETFAQGLPPRSPAPARDAAPHFRCGCRLRPDLADLEGVSYYVSVYRNVPRGPRRRGRRRLPPARSAGSMVPDAVTTFFSACRTAQ